MLFRPTYKYDYGSETYDSSEKQRIPAWTGTYSPASFGHPTDVVEDRVLYKGPSLNLTVYSRAELKGSDHRPGELLLNISVYSPDTDDTATVFTIFRAELRVIDHAKRASLSHLLLENVTSTAPGEKLDEKLASLAFTTDEPDCTSSSAKLRRSLRIVICSATAQFRYLGLVGRPRLV